MLDTGYWILVTCHFVTYFLVIHYLLLTTYFLFPISCYLSLITCFLVIHYLLLIFDPSLVLRTGLRLLNYDLRLLIADFVLHTSYFILLTSYFRFLILRCLFDFAQSYGSGQVFER